MDRKRPLHHPPQVSQSEDSDSSDGDFESDEEQEQAFVRSDRVIPSQSQETSSSSDSDDSDPEAHRVAAQDQLGDPPGSDSESESESDSSSHSEDGARKRIGALLSKKRKDSGNGSAKRVFENSSSAQKPVKLGQKDDQGAKKARTEAPKRERDNTVEEKGPVKKRFKDSSDNASKGEQSVGKSHFKEISHVEKAGREKHTPVQNGDRKAVRESISQAPSRDSGKEPAKRGSRQRIEEKGDSQLHASNQSENASEKKGPRSDEEVKHDKKVIKNSESEILKEAPSPQKPRKTTQMWVPKDEIAVSTEVLNLVKSGSEIPIKKVDVFWSKLYEQVQNKLEAEFTKEQLCDKVKRMKTRYLAMAEKVKESQKPFKHRNNNDEALFGLWSQIWGKTESDESDDTEEEDEGKEKEEVSKLVAAAKTASVKEVKLKEDKMDSDATKGNQRKTSSKTEGSQSQDNDDGRALEGNGTSGVSMELGGKVIKETKAEVAGDGSNKSLSDLAIAPKDTGGLLVQESNRSSFPPSDFAKVLQDEIHASLLEMQITSKQILEEWLNKSMSVVENAVKTSADKSRLMNIAGIGGFCLPPYGSWEFMDVQLTQGEQAFQQQWYELHLQELEVYSQRLQLMQRECHLKQEQLKLQLEGLK